jgi:hypothetical protein
VIGYGLDGPGSILFSTASRLTLGLAQPPIQWVPAALSLGVKQQEREADYSLPSSAKVKNSGDIPLLLSTSSERCA